ncbi:hypothetical protein [Streptomyces werraensis]|uniref:hypothetical protein n=1 Tax=Streptomyces werraensis TaxID=68284 RepID=UPI003435C557
MEEYVLVALEDYDKVIKYGPVLLEDPSTYPVPEGNRIMLASEALAQGYRYPEGGAAFAPEGEDAEAGEETGDGESDNDADGEPAEDHGQGARGAQGREGGQGAQAQPGSGRKRRGKARDDDSEK